MSFSIPVCFFPFYYIIFLYRPIYFLRRERQKRARKKQRQRETERDRDVERQREIKIGREGGRILKELRENCKHKPLYENIYFQ